MTHFIDRSLGDASCCGRGRACPMRWSRRCHRVLRSDSLILAPTGATAPPGRRSARSHRSEMSLFRVGFEKSRCSARSRAVVHRVTVTVAPASKSAELPWFFVAATSRSIPNSSVAPGPKLMFFSFTVSVVRGARLTGAREISFRNTAEGADAKKAAQASPTDRRQAPSARDQSPPA